MKKLIKALEKKGFFSEALQVRRVVSESIFNVKDILDNIDLIKSRLDKQGYSLSERLGKGEHGAAFTLSGDKVLKITTDPAEIETAAKLLGIDRSTLYRKMKKYVINENFTFVKNKSH